MSILLRRLRKERGWSQSELARRSGIHSSTISLIESGRLTPYDTQIDKIADAFGVSKRRAAQLVRDSESSE